MIVRVLVEIKAKAVDKTFDYQVPSELQKNMQVGIRVIVPFGAQELEGYVLEITNTTNVEELKEVIAIKDEEIILNDELMKIGLAMKEETLCSLSSAYITMLPRALKARKKADIKKKYTTFLSLNTPIDVALNLAKNENQKTIVSLFASSEFISKKEAQEISSSATNTLIKNHILKEEAKETYRYQVKEWEQDEKKELNQEQRHAYAHIVANLTTAKTFLLQGVTGSGKTEIYMQLIEKVIHLKKQALVLVPEISLTPQFVANFARRFEDNIAVLHSGLSEGEKYDEWRKINRGEVSIVIGARSAIFAPLKNIGIIIVDECHSDSYKQENTPKYRVLDIATFRSNYHTCPLVLGSATPTLEMAARGKKGVYELLELKHRVNQFPLPTCTIVDMKEEVKQKSPIISRKLQEEIAKRLELEEQVMLLLNRRGYSTNVMCSSCGFTYKCPHCDITLTYHKTTKSLRCHYCGYTKYVDARCPNCHEDALNYLGLGTEKLETILKEKFPKARVIRMDTDTTARKGVLEKIIEEFKEGNYDILIGTQMISKGLDFPKVTLVGIVNADLSFNIPDFRSGEKTFALLYQASGRAGRSNIPGSVIIQTYNPENYILNCVKEQNYEKFYQYEMDIRRNLKYPPYYFLAQIIIKSKDYELAKKEAMQTVSYIKQNREPHTIVLGPTTANVFRKKNTYHFEILIKYRFDTLLKDTLKQLDQLFITKKNVSIDIDMSY